MVVPCRNCASVSVLLALLAVGPEAVHLLSDSAKALELPVGEGLSSSHALEAGPGGTNAAGSGTEGVPWEGLDESATKAKIAEIWQDFGSKTVELPEKPSPKFSKSEMVVLWDSSRVEALSTVSFFWDHACAGNAPVGNCTFQKKDKKSNPPGLHVSLSLPLDEKARVVLSAVVKVLGITKSFSAECNACDDTCAMKMGLAGTASMTLPVCPLSETFDLIMPEMDFSRIPSFIRGYSATTLVLKRGTGDKVFEATLDTWV